MTHALTYDTLPANSTLRREVKDGMIKITAAAEEPGGAARRHAKRLAAVPAAMLSFATLIAFMAAIGSTYLANRSSIGGGMAILLVVAFIVFCAALFLFAWKAQYAARIESLERALQQTTILAASPGRLLVETAGPFGQASYEMAAPLFRVVRSGSIWSLEIREMGGDSLQALRGRSGAELAWVIRALDAAIKR